MGWLRACGHYDLGEVLPNALILVFAGTVVVGIATARRVAAWRAPQTGSVFERWAIRGGLAILVLAASVIISWVMEYWAGMMGAYAIPTADGMGIVIVICAMGLGAASAIRRERATAIALVGILLGSFTLVTAYLLDRLTRSPYLTVRQFAAATYREDDRAMERFLSSRSTRHLLDPEETYSSLSRRKRWQLNTVASLQAESAREVVLVEVDIKGRVAHVSSVVPYPGGLTAMRVAGHGGDIPLVRENGVWKIDVYRDLLELLKRSRANR